jgi:hypothetical protein
MLEKKMELLDKETELNCRVKQFYGDKLKGLEDQVLPTRKDSY